MRWRGLLELEREVLKECGLWIVDCGGGGSRVVGDGGGAG